ncbi:MAG: hypothetical protein PHI98_08680 [Eubacteriales bacterium]|nr:hypothetical protein [Eubacteriales bacterium]
MANETKRYSLGGEEDEPLELQNVLEPYEPSAPGNIDFPGSNQPDLDYADNPYEPAQNGYQQEDGFSSYEDEEYSDYHEQLDHEGKMRTAVGAFNVISALIGVVVILVLITMLVSLFSWLQTDVIHSITLLQSGIS